MAQIGPFLVRSRKYGDEHKKETGRCPGGKHDRRTQIRGVWGKSWVLNTSHCSRYDTSTVGATNKGCPSFSLGDRVERPYPRH